jgi:hypothetical protein
MIWCTKAKGKEKWHFPSFTLFMFVSDIADNLSQHAHPFFKHYSSSGQMSLWANDCLGKCLSGQMSLCANVFWANVFLGKRPFGQMSSGQMSFWANVFLGKRLLGKRLMGKCPSGQMSFWANVFWADVFWANVVLGKRLWANVSGQMSFGQMSGHLAREDGGFLIRESHFWSHIDTGGKEMLRRRKSSI